MTLVTPPASPAPPTRKSIEEDLWALLQSGDAHVRAWRRLRSQIASTLGRPSLMEPPDVSDQTPSRHELRMRRQALGISQKDLAAVAHVSRAQLCSVELGQRKSPMTRFHLGMVLTMLEQKERQ